MGKIVSVYEHFGLRTNFRNELSSWTEVLLYQASALVEWKGVFNERTMRHSLYVLLKQTTSYQRLTWCTVCNISFEFQYWCRTNSNLGRCIIADVKVLRCSFGVNVTSLVSARTIRSLPFCRTSQSFSRGRSLTKSYFNTSRDMKSCITVNCVFTSCAATDESVL